MMIAAVTHLSLLLLSCCWLQKEEETGVHSSAFHKHFFQLLKYFWVGFPYLFHTYFSFFPHWISERLHLHLLPHLSLIPSYYHIWWLSYLGNNFVSDGHFLNRFCLAKPKWVNMWINLLIHTISPLHRGQLSQAVGFPNSWLEIHTSMFDFQLPVRNPTASW